MSYLGPAEFVEQPQRNGHVFYYRYQIRLNGADCLKGESSTAAYTTFPTVEVRLLHFTISVRFCW